MLASDRFCADRHGLHEAVALPVLGHQREAAGDALGDASREISRPSRKTSPPTFGDAAEDAFEQFGAPGAHQPVDADDLAGPHVERQAVDHRARRRPTRRRR